MFHSFRLLHAILLKRVFCTRSRRSTAHTALTAYRKSRRNNYRLTRTRTNPTGGGTTDAICMLRGCNGDFCVPPVTAPRLLVLTCLVGTLREARPIDTFERDLKPMELLSMDCDMVILGIGMLPGGIKRLPGAVWFRPAAVTVVPPSVVFESDLLPMCMSEAEPLGATPGM